MAVNDIRKINVRSPFFVEVVDEYLGVEPTPDPDPTPDPEDPIEEPVILVNQMLCGEVFYFGRTVGNQKFRLSVEGRNLGSYTFRLAGVKTPVKYRVYTEGETPGAYSTEGWDTYSMAWTEETGETPSNLSTTASAPTGVTKTFIYTTDAATVSVSKVVVVELLMPLITESNMSLETVSCQPLTPSVSPLTTNFVTVLTIESINPIHLKTSHGAGNPVWGSPSDLTITLNGTSYPLPYNSQGVYGILRIVFSDATPLLAPTTNNWIYSSATQNADYFSDTVWTFNQAPHQIPILHVNESAINEGENTLIMSTPYGVTWAGFVGIRSHPVIQEGGNNIIRTKFDGGDTFNQSYLKGISNHYSWEVPMEHTVKFTGGNTINVKSTTTNRMKMDITHANGNVVPNYTNQSNNWDNRVVSGT